MPIDAGTVWVEGELGNVTRPASGHLYFTLKDARAQVRCAMFKPKSQWLRFVPRDGLQVRARGRVTLYEARGEYQLVLDHMEEAGEGALRRAFEQLKARLAAEGLFDPARKRVLPAFPRPGGPLDPTGSQPAVDPDAVGPLDDVVDGGVDEDRRDQPELAKRLELGDLQHE